MSSFNLAKRLQGISFIFDLSGCLRSSLPELLEICFDFKTSRRSTFGTELET